MASLDHNPNTTDVLNQQSAEEVVAESKVVEESDAVAESKDVVADANVVDNNVQQEQAEELDEQQGAAVVSDEMKQTLSSSLLSTSSFRISKDLFVAAKNEVASSEAQLLGDEDPDKRYCVCRLKWNGKDPLIQCDMCDEWFHFHCVGILPGEKEPDEFYCVDCEEKYSEEQLKAATERKKWEQEEEEAAQIELQRAEAARERRRQTAAKNAAKRRKVGVKDRFYKSAAEQIFEAEFQKHINELKDSGYFAQLEGNEDEEEEVEEDEIAKPAAKPRKRKQSAPSSVAHNSETQTNGTTSSIQDQADDEDRIYEQKLEILNKIQSIDDENLLMKVMEEIQERVPQACSEENDEMNVDFELIDLPDLIHLRTKFSL